MVSGARRARKNTGVTRNLHDARGVSRDADADEIEAAGGVPSSALGPGVPRDPRRIAAEVEVDPYEAHVGTTKMVPFEDGTTCQACGGLGHSGDLSASAAGRFPLLDDCPHCRGVGTLFSHRVVPVTVPPRARDGDRICVGPADVVVSIVSPRDSLAIRLAASLALLAAIAFLLFLLSL